MALHGGAPLVFGSDANADAGVPHDLTRIDGPIVNRERTSAERSPVVRERDSHRAAQIPWPSAEFVIEPGIAHSWPPEATARHISPFLG